MDDVSLKQVPVGWMARSVEHRVAAVGITEREARAKLEGILKIMRQLTARRERAEYNGGNDER